MGRIRNTIELAKTSWGVLQKDRELVALPVLSFLGAALVLAIFVIPGILALPEESAGSAAAGEEQALPALSLILFVLGSLAATVVSVFFTGALVAGAHERMSGGDPTVGSAIGRATERIPGLVPWALLTATVGMIIQALREQPAVSAIHPRWHRSRLERGVVPHHPGDRDRRQGTDRRLQVVGRPPLQTWGENSSRRSGSAWSASSPRSRRSC